MNIIEIAKITGVSKSTVSRYLNNGYVGEDARNRIKKVIEETGFIPQRHAISMRTKKTNLIGVILPKISTETAPRVVEGITEVMSMHGYDVLIANTNLLIEKEIEYLKLFKKNQVDGIIFMATKVTDNHIKFMNDVDVPIVVVSQSISGFPCVYHDDYNASKEIVEYLISKNHKNIGFIGVYEEDKSVGVERKRGYIDKLKEHNIDIIKENIKIGDFSEKSGYDLTKELLKNKNIPTAIFAVTDNLAFGVIECLKDNMYSIPNDIAVVGIGDSRLSKVITPKLTTMHYSYKTSGKEAAKIILNLLDSDKNDLLNKKKNIKLVSRLVERDSV
ncbi:LacI family DNA-binding transcriptional regulator [Clostridium carnis]